jgi:hypothetical protein
MSDEIIRAYKFARTQQQINAIDACHDVAAWHGVPASDLAAWIIASNTEHPITNQRLALI